MFKEQAGQGQPSSMRQICAIMTAVGAMGQRHVSRRHLGGVHYVYPVSLLNALVWSVMAPSLLSPSNSNINTDWRAKVLGEESLDPPPCIIIKHDNSC
jgi:hypothetical protein